MKKQFIILILFFSINSFSQKGFKPIVRFGINNSNISNFNLTRSFDFYFGLGYPVKIGKNKTLQVALTYDRINTKSSNLEPYFLNDKGTGIKMDFLAASSSYNFLSRNNFKLYIGPFISVITSQNFSQYDPSFIDLTPNLDAGLIAGIRYNFLSNFDVEFGYKKGFMDVIILRDDRLNNTTNSMQLGIAYKFKSKK